ncbi:copper amine oxidase N-terminal domain-containing protein [Caldisalinibacter kiritimatiensis]|uniref:N-acetylmuramoyl-L-alanine amidase n=1 Tax=Caldisalinibacter kiritimatiensis TaxID=1304284 RepID=R1CHZ1_9FIRM|nr:copper amine oxidase N-terminal domain-containing protein [Caldisalinibacter kiritimatiensis]EOD01900.1 N-acetylmuramoyl-L-alanine amidase [Caldisalinibacter kiritimatiensis]
MEQQKAELKSQMRNVKQQMKQVIRNRYTKEEWEQLQQAAEEIEGEDEGLSILPVENIFIENVDVKFDTPPVIKTGRTLIPVRAITEGFGANVEWNGEERKVTITRDDVEIVLQIDSSEVLVNGEESTIDVPSSIYSNRTYVPLRFILETFKLSVNWDGETETIEIEEDEEESEVVEDTDDAATESEEEATEEETTEETTTEEDVTETTQEDEEGTTEDSESTDETNQNTEETTEESETTENDSTVNEENTEEEQTSNEESTTEETNDTSNTTEENTQTDESQSTDSTEDSTTEEDTTETVEDTTTEQDSSDTTTEADEEVTIIE